MFGLGWAEIMVAAVVGLIVIGPKELPVVFRKIGQFVGKAKGMARDFSRAMNDAADESGIKDTVETMNSMQDGIRSVTDPTTKWKDFVPGSETAKLTEERAKKSNNMQNSMEVKAQGSLDEAKAANTAVESYSAPEQAMKVPLKKSAPKKPVATKAPTKPALEKKTVAILTKPVIKKNAVNIKSPKLGKKT